MPNLTLFYLDHCPYCHSARRAIEALKAESPAYANIEIEWVEESRQPERAEGLDYYYVPSVFDGERKLFEARPGQDDAAILAGIRAAFDAVL